jgi:hypothetical protein
MNYLRVAPLILFGFIMSTLASPAVAGSVTTFADIDTWIGSGDQEAALVIDWNDGKAPGLWGYRFTGTKTGQQMFLDIVAAQVDLFARIGPDGEFGIPLYGIGYNRNGGDFGISDNLGDESLIFNGSTIAQTGAPDEFDDGPATVNDPEDSYHEGWWTGFWSYWNSTGLPENGGWATPSFGASTRALIDGDWDGLSFDPTFAFTDPPAVTLTVPEPNSVMLLRGLGLTALLRRRRD